MSIQHRTAAVGARFAHASRVAPPAAPTPAEITTGAVLHSVMPLAADRPASPMAPAVPALDPAAIYARWNRTQAKALGQ